MLFVLDLDPVAPVGMLRIADVGLPADTMPAAIGSRLNLFGLASVRTARCADPAVEREPHVM